MKEVTYEDWQKNPTPRMMWVWDSNENAKQKRKVIYFLDSRPPYRVDALTYRVVALTEDKTSTEPFSHCAEIEEPKTRRMTHKELSRWLREKPTRECKYLTSEYICSTFEYREYKQDEEVIVDVRIREDDGEWREPLVEIEE